MALRDYAHMAWNPRILEHGPNYDDPFLSPSDIKDGYRDKKRDNGTFNGRRIYVISHAGRVEYRSIREALMVFGKWDAVGGKDMDTLKRICKKYGLECGDANA